MPALAGDGPLAFLRPDHAQYRHPTLRRARRDGIHYELDLSDFLQWSIYFATERAEREPLYALVRPRQTVLDIGTNVGETLLNFSRLVGPAGMVIGFEPNPDTWRCASGNLARNDFPHARIEQVGLGREPGRLHFGRRTAGNAGADAVMREGPGTFEIPVTTLDQFLAKAGVAKVDLVKIDIEGSELNALRGAAEVLRRDRPTLFIELSDVNLREQGDSAAALVAFLEAAGYVVTAAVGGSRLDAGTDLTNCFLDVIARAT